MILGQNKKTARAAGLLYLLMGITGAFGMLYVPSQLISADAATTATSIATNELLFRLGILSQLLCQLLFIFLALVLFRLFQDINRNAATTLLILVAVSVPVAFLNTFNQAAALVWVNNTDLLKAFEPEELHSLMMGFIRLHEHGIYMVELFWGLWLFPFGYLVYHSGFIPKILGILLIINCFAYLVESITALIVPEIREAISSILMIPMSVGELGILLWLLIIGVRRRKTETQLKTKNAEV